MQSVFKLKSFCFLLLTLIAWGATISAQQIEWQKINELPAINGYQHPGLAGCFAGHHNDVLIIAGGANFPNARPWEGGEKKWYSDIYLLKNNEGNFQWEKAKLKLPTPLAYGVSINTPNGVICIGGNNSKRNSDLVFRLTYKNQEVHIDQLLSLHFSLSNMAGCLLNNSIYISGGQTSIQPPTTTNRLFKLNLNQQGTNDFKWQELPSMPGTPRAFHLMAAQNDGDTDCLFVFSGRNFGHNQAPEILHDGFKYNPVLKEWYALPQPRKEGFPGMAGNAIATGNEFILIPTGAKGDKFMKEWQLKQQLKAADTQEEKNKIQKQILDHLNNHPGFNTKGWVYNTITNTLSQEGTLPTQGIATAPLVEWNNDFYIISGEIKPGIRTPDIIKGTFTNTAKSFGWLNTFVLIIYFGILLWIGIFFSKRQKNTDDYFKGGGRVPWWAAGLSIFGTALSAITFMAIPAKSYVTDWSYIWLNVAVLIAAPIVVYKFIPLYRQMNITTAYEYLEKRFNLLLRLAGSTSFILFQIGRMGVVLFLPAIALNVVTGIDIYVCILLMGILSLLYTFMGGIEAVIWTDAMQVVVLLGGALLSLALIVVNIDGGFSGIVQTAVQDQKFAALDLAFDIRQPGLWVVLFGGLFSQFGTYATDQTMVQRYLTTPDLRDAKRSLWTNIVLTIPATFLFFFVGTALYAFYKQNPAAMNYNITNGDAIFPWFIVNELPDGIVGILISGIFAAAMSSVSSSINSAATAYAADFHFRLAGKGNDMQVARIATVVVGLLGTLFALLMASWGIKSLWDVFNKVLGLIIGSMGGLFILGVLYKRVTSLSATIGFIVSIAIQLILVSFTDMNLLLYTATGVIACTVIGFVSSLFLNQNK
ncbi:MAG: sodium/solute symporter [Marinifilum sp.]|jgi:cyclically-permuted mutarotase family protein|nr:sodium/solute symporter [Marinifilum sp.]